MSAQEKTRWGICGAGKIAHDFTSVLVHLSSKHSVAMAVGSRDLDRAQKFADLHKIPKAYGSYEELAKDPEIDVVYVNTMTVSHCALSKLMLEAGKNVLCEKPMGLTLRQNKEVLELAKQKGLFYMEGFWTRCFPIMSKLRETIDSGAIGDVKQLVVNFGFDIVEKERINQKEQGGGVVLDLGCYTLQLARFIFPEDPIKITATGILFPSGVDMKDNITLVYSGDRMASINIGGECEYDQTASIFGTKGIIHMPYIWTPDEIITCGESFSIPLPVWDGGFMHLTRCEGFVYEQEHVHECLRKGKKESSKIPHSDSLAISSMSDEIRRQLGVVFDEDNI